MSSAGDAPVLLSGLGAIAHRYAGFIVDVWGVLHDGVRAYDPARDALRRLRAAGAPVCLISNAPRSAAAVAARLVALGIGADCYDHLLTSGQATIDALSDAQEPELAALGRRYYFMGPADTRSLLDGLGYSAVVDPSRATFILNTGSEPGTDLAHYETALRTCARRALPMICANPDLFVRIGAQQVMCAGAIARRYAALGGSVRYYGKPHPAIYRHALALMACAPGAVLALGDGLETDIAGARTLGIDAGLVLGGLNADCLGRRGGEEPARDRLQARFDRSGHRPDYIIPYLRW
ncbi:MAG: TIGR01459 family HAD-type hydrolase [Dongiaceae bacterium]